MFDYILNFNLNIQAFILFVIIFYAIIICYLDLRTMI
jgi:hypothetical protein